MPGLTYLGQIFHVTEEYEDITDAIFTKGRGLSPSKRLIFESADFEVQGNAILERHPILTPDSTPDQLRLDRIAMRHKYLNIEQIKQYKDYMLRAGFTYPAAISVADTMIKREGIGPALSWLEVMAREMEACDVSPEDAMHPSHRAEDMPTYGFHKVDDIFSTGIETPWFLKQPDFVQRLLTTPERCKNIYQLKKLGKGCYEAEKESALKSYQRVYLSMTNDQRAVFWDKYNLRKRNIMEHMKLSSTARALVKRIKGSRRRDLPRLKANLVKLQKGQLKVSNPPSEEEWEVVWWNFSRRG